jgi:hypothetical protein
MDPGTRLGPYEIVERIGAWRADIDIDDANGLEHLFQVLKHQLSNGRTYPYGIRDILIAHQKLDPGYELPV